MRTDLAFDQVYENAANTVVGFGSIRIRVYEDWAGDVAEPAAAVRTAPEFQVLTSVEPFSIDGVPAFRVIYSVPSQADLEYITFAFAAFAQPCHFGIDVAVPSTYTSCGVIGSPPCCGINAQCGLIVL